MISVADHGSNVGDSLDLHVCVSSQSSIDEVELSAARYPSFIIDLKQRFERYNYVEFTPHIYNSQFILATT